MTTETMTIHEALSELKVLDKRIKKEISEAKFADFNQRCNTKINGIAINDYKTTIQAKYAKITDLIKRRTAIKKAVTNSNATTVVTIGDVSMTVAEAIEYKRSGIEFKEMLLNKVSADYNIATRNIHAINDTISDKAISYVERAYANKESVNKDVIESAKAKFIEDNSLDLIDPIGCEKIIESLSTETDTFMSKVDATLSISNALTKITVEY